MEPSKYKKENNWADQLKCLRKKKGNLIQKKKFIDTLYEDYY